MSTGVIAAAWALAAFVLVETVLPQAFAALRKWRRAAGEKEPKREAIAPHRTVAGAATGAVKGDPLGVAPGEAAARSLEACACRGGRDSTGLSAPGRDSTDLSVSGRGGTTDANQLWDEAREMPHDFIPDPVKDGDYLAKVYAAAKLGHLEAMAKLGEYAFRRKALVEAYYWTALAELKGAKGLERTLRKIRSAWLAARCPAQHGNTHEGFSEQQGSFARALLRIRCAVNTPLARARMRELAEQGCAEAQLFLRNMT